MTEKGPGASYTIGRMRERSGVAPLILPRQDHPISRKNISRNALKVMYRLHSAGYKAHLVGGSVRDLMLGRRPKDYDVGTDARPNEVRRLFGNSRVIGRRFRLVHVYFHDGEVVEVSTFRRGAEPAAAVEEGEPERDVLITSDNLWGSPREDAFRRDFTINALFYDVADFSVVDYTGGIPDLQSRLVRAIGDPDVRFREDPVRMLRACEFAGRLGFGIEAATQEAIHRHRRDLERASPARLTEEIAQLLRCGHAGAAMQWMLELGMMEVLLPEAYAMVSAAERGLGDFGQIPPSIDALVGEERQLSDTVLVGALLLPQVLLRRYDVEALDQRPLTRAAVEALVRETAGGFFKRFPASNAKALQVVQALTGFWRLCEPRWKLPDRLRYTRRPHFEDSLLLLELLVRATGEGEEALEQWRAAALRRAAAPGGEAEESEEVERARRRRRRRRRR